MRIFKNSPGSSWKSHAPPIYQDENGTEMNRVVMTREHTLSLGIKMYHYGYVAKSQAEFKKKYYNNSTLVDLWNRWQENKDLPIINGDRSKLFLEKHPEIIYKLIGENDGRAS